MYSCIHVQNKPIARGGEVKASPDASVEYASFFTDSISVKWKRVRKATPAPLPTPPPGPPAPSPVLEEGEYLQS